MSWRPSRSPLHVRRPAELPWRLGFALWALAPGPRQGRPGSRQNRGILALGRDRQRAIDRAHVAPLVRTRAGAFATGRGRPVARAVGSAWRWPCREPRLVQGAETARHPVALLQRIG